MASIQARATVPRIYPAGRAAALFAVCGPDLAGRRLTVDGRRLVAVPYDRFSLLLNYVDPEAYAPGELERRRSDAPWQALEARVYERAIERASVHGAVLPMRSLTVVADATDLDAYVEVHSERWSRSLARLGKRRECAIHIFAGPHVMLAGDEPYSIRVARRVSRSGRLPHLEGPPGVTSFARDLWQACTSIARATRRIAPREQRGLLWSAALLLGNGDVPDIGKIIEQAAVAGSALGITTYLEGPRPPFSFA